MRVKAGYKLRVPKKNTAHIFHNLSVGRKVSKKIHVKSESLREKILNCDFS